MKTKTYILDEESLKNFDLAAVLEEMHKDSSCTNKNPYSEDAAIRAAYAMAEKKGEPFDAYKCEFCPHWHIGHAK